MGIKADLNSFNFIGHLVKDAELVTTANGVTYSKFTVANNSVKKSNGKFEQYTSYFDLRIFGKYAETVNKYLVKGQTIAVTAAVKQSRWEANGEKRCTNSIICQKIQLVGSKNSENDLTDLPETNSIVAPAEIEAESSSESDIDYEVF